MQLKVKEKFTGNIKKTTFRSSLRGASSGMQQKMLTTPREEK